MIASSISQYCPVRGAESVFVSYTCNYIGNRLSLCRHSNRNSLKLTAMQEIAPSKVRERFSTNIYHSSISDLNVPEWVDWHLVPLEREMSGNRRAAAIIKGNGYRGARGKGCSARTAGVCLSAGCSVAPRELAGRTPFPDRDRRSPPWSRHSSSAASLPPPGQEA